MSETHTQCRLAKGNIRQISWIPSEFAKEGNIIGLMEYKINEKGIKVEYWDEGWEVLSTGAIFPSKYVAERERDWKRTRNASDI